MFGVMTWERTSASFKFIDDGQPESRDFDNNYAEPHARPRPEPSVPRQWRTVKLPHAPARPSPHRLFG